VVGPFSFGLRLRKTDPEEAATGGGRSLRISGSSKQKSAASIGKIRACIPQRTVAVIFNGAYHCVARELMSLMSRCTDVSQNYSRGAIFSAASFDGVSAGHSEIQSPAKNGR
jgi:hypothetical protein